MSKSQEQESIDNIRQQLDEEYKNLSWVEAGWAAIGSETGNKKYDELNKQYLDLNKDNLGIIQSVIQAVGNVPSALQFTWEASQVLPDLALELNNLRKARSATTNVDSIEAGCKIIADAESLVKKCASVLHSETISNSSKETILQSKVIPYLLTPILNKRLSKITKNFQTSETEKINILDKISPKFVRELSTLGVDLISKALDASMPFVKDVLPSITKLASLALSDSDKIADVIQKAQLIKSLPKEEKSKEVKELISTLIEIKNNNPEISKIIEKDLPELLTKHASSLGPVVDEFLNKTPKGQKLKLDGEKLVKIAGKHAPELIKIADKFSKHEYGKIIVPALKLLSDPKVLGVVAETIVNLGKSKFSKDKEAVGLHTSKVLEERQREIGNKQAGRKV